ncbi:MAG: DUF1822 family protein [Cyanobacteria bacterium P01_A01_bin.84]
MLELDDLTVIYPEHLWIEISDIELEEIWSQIPANHYTHAAAYRRDFLNNLCLNTFLKWLQDEPELFEKYQKSSSSQDLNYLEEFVNGVNLNFNQTGLVLLPSEQGSICELRIPQEWVDIPNLAGNYYLAVQLNVEENWLRIWGFISYEQVREKAKYDPIDRTYCLNNCDLIADINILWVAQEFLSPKQPQIKPLPTLSAVQAKGIIDQLSKPTPYSPRLDISFSVWGAILGTEEYRQILYAERLRKVQFKPVENTRETLHNLSLWFENIFDEGWRSLDDFLSCTDVKAFQFRSDSVLNEVCVKGAKLIDLGMQLDSQSLMLLIGLLPQVDNKIGIRVQLYPRIEQTHLPANVKLTLLSDSGKILQSVESRSYDNYIQLKRFKLPTGKFFSIQVALKDVKIIENFVLEGFACSGV